MFLEAQERTGKDGDCGEEEEEEKGPERMRGKKEEETLFQPFSVQCRWSGRKRESERGDHKRERELSQNKALLCYGPRRECAEMAFFALVSTFSLLHLATARV